MDYNLGWGGVYNQEGLATFFILLGRIKNINVIIEIKLT